LLNRDPLAYWAIRDGSPWPWPPYAHFGPKVMLMNGSQFAAASRSIHSFQVSFLNFRPTIF
jgi:hypothetical protein